jgi:hypothetical protein
MTWRSSAAEMKPLLSRSKTLKASRISSSESVSFILRAIIVRNSGAVSQGTRRSTGRGVRTREVNGAVVVGVDLVNHVLELRLAGVLAERAHDGAEFLGGDLTWGASPSAIRFRRHIVVHGGGTDHRRPCPVARAPSVICLHRVRALGSRTRTGHGRGTHKQGECLLELGDLLLGKRVSLSLAVSLGRPRGGRLAPCFPRRGRETRGRRGVDAPCLLVGVWAAGDCRAVWCGIVWKAGG